MIMRDIDAMWTLADLAARMGVSIRQAQRIAKKHGRALGRKQLGHRTVRFAPAKVEAFLAGDSAPKLGLQLL